MKRKLSQKEKGEVVTKGFLQEYLQEVLESKNYVTKEYAHNMFEYYQKDMKRHIDALMEDNNHKFEMLIETFSARFERIERHVGLPSF